MIRDQNLSPKLVDYLSNLYPQSAHVSEYNLDQVHDIKLWKYAREEGYIIVSKDSDLGEMSIVHGSPPKVIWIRRSNCSTKEIENILRRNYKRLEELYQSENAGILLLY